MLFDAYAASKVGPTVTTTLPGSGSEPTTVDLYSLIGQVGLNAFTELPILFAVQLSIAGFLGQAAVGFTFATGGSPSGINLPGLLIAAGVYWPVMVEGKEDSVVGFRSASASAGTIYFTIVNKPGPGFITFK